MSRYTREYEDAVRGEAKASNAYDINILNAMGREQKNVRNLLYQQALRNPDNYLEKRNKAVFKVIDEIVNETFQTFRDLLLNGQVKGVQKLYYPDGQPYYPKLPEAKITQFAVKATETIERILEDAMEECMPETHTNLAHKRSAEIAQVASGVSL